MYQKIGKEVATKRLENILFPRSEKVVFQEVRTMIKENKLTYAHLLIDEYDNIMIQNKTIYQKMAFERLRKTSLSKTDKVVYEIIRNMIHHHYLTDAYFLMDDYDECESSSNYILERIGDNTCFNIFFSDNTICLKLHSKMNKDTKIGHLLEKDGTIKYILDIENREYNKSTIMKKIKNGNIKTMWRKYVMAWLFSVANEDNAFSVVMHAQQYLDRFVSISEKINKLNYQLYGVAAYHIAYKYIDDDFEDGFSYNTIFGSRLEYLVDLTDNAYTTERLIEAEIEMLNILGYNMVTVTIDEVLDFILGDIKLSSEASKLKTILLMICITSELSVSYKPSVLAHAIIYNMIGLEISRNSKFSHDIEYFYRFSGTKNALNL